MASEMLGMIVDMMRAQRSAISPEDDPVEMRARMESMVDFLALPPDVATEPVRVNGVPAEWVSTPEAGEGHVVLYLHGGAYVVGSINTHRDLAARISRASGARVLNLDYRLEPEHPQERIAFMLEDCAPALVLAQTHVRARLSLSVRLNHEDLVAAGPLAERADRDRDGPARLPDRNTDPY